MSLSGSVKGYEPASSGIPQIYRAAVILTSWPHMVATRLEEVPGGAKVGRDRTCRLRARITKLDRGGKLMIANPRATIACPFCGRLNGIDLSRAVDRPKCGECAKPLLLDRPVAATDGTLDRILQGTNVPVLVDFYADWCGPCKVMAPLLDEFARARTGRALVAKLDTDRNPESAARYEIRGIPTLILFRNGAEAQRQVGAVPKEVLETMVE